MRAAITGAYDNVRGHISSNHKRRCMLSQVQLSSGMTQLGLNEA